MGSCCVRHNAASIKSRVYRVSLEQDPHPSGAYERDSMSRTSHSRMNGSRVSGSLQRPRRSKEPVQKDMDDLKRHIDRIAQYPHQNRNEVFVFIVNLHQLNQTIKLMEGNHLQLVPASFHGIFEDSNMCLVPFQKLEYLKTYNQPFGGLSSFVTHTLHCYVGNHILLIDRLEELGTENNIIGHFIQDSMDTVNLVCCPKPLPYYRPSIHIIRLASFFDHEELGRTFDICKKENLKFMFSLTALVKGEVEVSLVFERKPVKIEYYVVDVSKKVKSDRVYQADLSEEITQHLSVENIDFFGFIENRNTETLYAVLGTDY